MLWKPLAGNEQFERLIAERESRNGRILAKVDAMIAAGELSLPVVVH
jgi:hypothetical protein